ncbi:hypothetical protein BD310DRAFT_978459 [Dichomitus squalens]|uniref:Uncharacterized protein n=1 Tax=Dichomitus squalens TaxID=114155 RepID=A0A4Q9PRE7_9APHY|nr:hypothetical protein BD310DRAFT_978459 [Dichomitus squalens]
MLIEMEGQVLRRLNASGVQHVAVLICDGDVRDHATITTACIGILFRFDHARQLFVGQ